MTPFGFIGLGEVGVCLARALANTGAPVFAYDISIGKKNAETRLRERCAGARVTFTSLPEMLANVRVILSTVPAKGAVKAARSCAPGLDVRHLYIDLNSTLPGAKRDIAAIVEARGAAFAEGVILGAVEANGSRVHILTGGPHAERAAALLRRHGLNAGAFAQEVGKATTYKLLRSIFYKGAEAALMECLLAARRHGMEAELWKDIVHTMDAHSFADTGGTWLRTHATAHERRADEMDQIVEMARGPGLDMTLARAAGGMFRNSAKVKLAKDFDATPRDLHAVVEALDRRLARQGAKGPPKASGKKSPKKPPGTKKPKQKGKQ